ncbi:VOC family protein [Halostella salina]|uniref:VOC family protein n=1 Tax=Halostella salina TaxID=1547897 RepID=UPI000EF7EC98|nr:VOC family protein [Halostella salina]
MQPPEAHHFGITVRDLEETVRFYSDVFDLDVVSRFSVSGESFADAVDVPDATGRFAHLDAGGARIELVEYDPSGSDASAHHVNQTGAKHLGLAVDDIDRFYAELPDHVDTLSEPRTTESGTRILFVCDPEDNLVEIVEA